MHRTGGASRTGVAAALGGAVTAVLLAVSGTATPPPAAISSSDTAGAAGTPDAAGNGTARVLLTGDVMLGRGVATRTAGDPAAALAGVRDVVAAADVAAANLESPLTARPHRASAGPNALEAPPSAASQLAAAGFDVLGVANNHAGDAGPGTVPDTLAALASAGLVGVGGGALTDAFTPRIVTAHGVRIAFLAVDATGAGPRAGHVDGEAAAPGVAWWDEPRLHAAVTDARRQADAVIVGLHGGTEYLTGADPGQTARARQLASWGVDVVWGHHPHVVQPVTTIDPDGDGRPTVVATSLGNLLFDQHLAATTHGLVLELVVGRRGVRAVRRGEVTIDAGRAEFARWLAPDAGSPAAVLHGSWWQLTSAAPRPPDTRRPDEATRGALVAKLAPGQLLDAAFGDVDADGKPEVVAAFRRPHRPTVVSRNLPSDRLVDAHGGSAHVGVYHAGDLGQVWVAGSVLEPVGTLAACDGWLAVGLTRLDDATTVTGVGAWRWGGFGFVTYPDLSGPGRPACADVDDDGELDPLAVERTVP